jgi:DNA-binding PadR family transcriptional regulator
MSSSKIVEKLRKKVIQNFMDILILTEINKDSLSGYDVMALIHKNHGVLVSSGTVYSLLYSLERDGMIEGEWLKRKRVYTLTEKGEQDIRLIMKANQEIQSFLKKITLLNANNHQLPTTT